MNNMNINWGSTQINWDQLREHAVNAATLAYCPYSDLEVGASALTVDGKLVTGCNVENTSLGLTMCAECTLVGSLHIVGANKLVAVSTRISNGELIMPCGRCRQVLYEFGGPGCQIDTPRGIETLYDILPDAPGTWKYEGSV